MLASLIWLVGAGFLAGQLARRLGAPPLIGMIGVGMILGPELGDRLSPDLLDLADTLRTIAVMVILMRAGLGLDRDKLVQQGSVAIRLGFLPALTEAIAVMAIAMVLFQFDWLTGLLLGCIVGAESPAVIVPGMLRLKRLGWGVAKGIPDVILIGSALSDVLILLLFSLLINLLTQGQDVGQDAAQFGWLPLQVISQVGLGTILGYGAARLLLWTLGRWTQTPMQEGIVSAMLALSLVGVAQTWPYFSGYLAVMALGFFVVEQNPPVARRLRQSFNSLWVVAEIILFVLMGASVQLGVLERLFLPGVVLLTLGLGLGRTVGWWLSTLGSNWTWKERLFLLPGNSAKATVQAAIGAIPLSLGIDGGEIMLAIAALSILITAPLGAWAIPLFAPRLLSSDPVDPTKVVVERHTVLLAIVDDVTPPEAVLTPAADLARRCNGEVIVWQSLNSGRGAIAPLIQKMLLDIPHQVVVSATPCTEGDTPPLAITISTVIKQHQVTEIIMGQATYHILQSTDLPSIPTLLVS
ncbi:MAG: cation:proton antiporter [Leptolyngbyaceae bacterium]|nr:cation:proton antiporter [Leptolyngbyaceae bacterium]